MPDLIHAAQRLIRPFAPELVTFVPEHYAEQGLLPNPVRSRQCWLGDLFSHRLFSRQYPGVPGRIHYQDNMLQNDSAQEIAHYLDVGRSGAENIERGLRLTGRSWADVEALLDFPSGFGRVLRHIVLKLDPRRITACELMHAGVLFCAQEFGVKPHPSPAEITALELPGTYDVIWVGSLFTHLPIETGMRLLGILIRALKPGGLAIISMQGPSCLAGVENYGFMFQGRRGEFEQQFETTGAAFLPYYPSAPGYGIALHKPEFIRATVPARIPEGEVFHYEERGYDRHQDVWTFRRR